MDVACSQLDIAWEDKPANYRRVENLVAAAGLAPGTLSCCPRCSPPVLPCAEGVAEPTDGPTARFLADLARRHAIFVEGGVVIRSEEDSRPRNEALVFGPNGRLLCRYAKLHLFSLAGESEHYLPGQSPAMFSWQDAQVCPAICYDLRFPELFRVAAAGAADLITVIACWPAAREEHWLALLRARAIENQCYVAAVNRCGSDPSGLAYSGRSQILDPRGVVLADAAGGAGVIRINVNLESQNRYRQKFPALRDIRAGLFLPKGPVRSSSCSSSP